MIQGSTKINNLFDQIGTPKYCMNYIIEINKRNTLDLQIAHAQKNKPKLAGNFKVGVARSDRPKQHLTT